MNTDTWNISVNIHPVEYNNSVSVLSWLFGSTVNKTTRNAVHCTITLNTSGKFTYDPTVDGLFVLENNVRKITKQFTFNLRYEQLTLLFDRLESSAFDEPPVSLFANILAYVTFGRIKARTCATWVWYVLTGDYIPNLGVIQLTQLTQQYHELHTQHCD